MIDDPILPRAGVFPIESDKFRWCVWAPHAKTVDLVLGSDRIAMAPLPLGYFAIEHECRTVSARYAYSLDGEAPRPDPWSRSQPEGVTGASAIAVPSSKSHMPLSSWRGVADRRDLVVYELHVGTFTPEGTFDAVLPRIPSLLDLGITCIELMPVSQFPGTRSWGYDGVFPFAVQNSYGGPEGLHRLIAECHALGMAVFMDVVYNHFGPEGNVLPRFGPYVSDKTRSDWGEAVNFDGRGSDSVRAMVLENVRMWVGEFHVDGLRIDAADQIYDRGPRHILAEIAEMAHREATIRGFPCHVFAETDLNDAPRFLRDSEHGGYGLDGYWNDDFHHAAHVALTGETQGYYIDFAGGINAVAKSFESIFVNDGVWSSFRGRRHGTSAEEFRGDRFLAFTQNHDQVGNRLHSDRHGASLTPAANRLAAGLLLLAPRVPMLFMGQEYGETNPFPYLCDYDDPALTLAVREGRKNEFSHFGWDEDPLDPTDPASRELAVLSWTWDVPVRAGLRALHHDLLAMRRDHPALRDFGSYRTEVIDECLVALHRGRTAPDDPRLGILFNFQGQSVAIPERIDPSTIVFRSEILRYGALQNPEPRSLMPYEFLVFDLS